MPKFPKMRETIKDSEYPLIVFLSKGEVASQTTKLRAFTSGDITIISNLKRMYSPVDGTSMNTVESASREVANVDFSKFNALTTMTCRECAAVAGVDSDLAFEIAGEDLICPCCAKATRLEYDETANSDEEESDEERMGVDALDVAELENDPEIEDVDDSEMEDSDEDNEDEDTSDDEDEDESETASLSDVTSLPFTGDEEADYESIAAIEAFILDESNSMEDKVAALGYLMANAFGDDTPPTEEDVADFITQSSSYSEEDASFAVELYLAKERASENDENPFTANDSHKAIFDKFKGAVAVYSSADSESPEVTGNLLSILKEDVVLIKTSDDKTMTVKFTDVMDGDGAAKLIGTAEMKKETANDANNAIPKGDRPDVRSKSGEIDAKTGEPKTNPSDVSTPAAPGKPAETLENKVTQDVPSGEEANDGEGENVKVDALDLTDENTHITLTSLNNDKSEIAMFIGGVHVGTLHRVHASEKAQALYDDTHKLSSAFRAAFAANRSNQRSPELSSFGYRPTTFTVRVGELFQKRLDSEVAKVRAEVAADATAQFNTLSNTIELAFVGLNKGVFKGSNDLATEIARVIARGGTPMKHAELEARKLLGAHSHGYVKSAIEKAKELSEQKDGFLEGVAAAVSAADYTGSADALIDTAPVVPVEQREVASDVIGGQKPVSTNAYSNIARRLGRR